MSRHHCHSTRRGARPSNCALSNNERHRGCQKRSHTNIYSLAHAIGMSPRAYHHCHSARRGTRPSNCALSNDKRPAAALTSPMTLIYPPIYMSVKLSKYRVVIVTAPVAERDQATAPSRTTSYTKTSLTYMPCSIIFHVPGSLLTSSIFSWSRRRCTLNRFPQTSILMV